MSGRIIMKVTVSEYILSPGKHELLTRHMQSSQNHTSSISRECEKSMETVWNPEITSADLSPTSVKEAIQIYYDTCQ
jgi:hypothetical protein